MNTSNFHSFTPEREIRGVEATIFHADGSRSVIGTLGTVTYDVDGTAHVSFTVPGPGDTVRLDLSEAA